MIVATRSLRMVGHPPQLVAYASALVVVLCVIAAQRPELQPPPCE